MLEATSDLTEPMLDAGERLPAPEGREAKAKELFTLIRRTEPLLKKSAEAIRSRDRAGLEKLNEQILDLALPARELARELDVPGCNPSENAEQ